MPEARDTFDLFTLRKRLGFNQLEMVRAMGMGSRTYFTLEQKPESANARHRMLAQYVSLKFAVEREDRSLAEATIAELAVMYCSMPVKAPD